MYNVCTYIMARRRKSTMAHQHSQSRTNSVTFRIRPSDKNLLEEAAARTGSDMTSFVLGTALQRAKEIAEREDVTVLTGAARERFIALLRNPPAPSRRFIENMRDRRHRVVD